MPSSKPTDGELEILKVLWQKGPSTVRQVNETLNLDRSESSQVGYTTTLKLMQIMYEKRFLSREKEGKTHRYKALLSQDDTQKHLVNKLLNGAFQGSAMKLVMQALGNRNTTHEELNEIRKFLDDLEDKLPE